MTRPILARIHPDALAHNYRLAKQHAPQGRAMAVIKADGYGHGFLQVVAALPEADGFALLNSENALTLRDNGETRPLVLLEGFFDVAELRACAQAGIGVAIHHEAQLRMLETTPLPATGAPLTVWLKLNTGMNRLGFTLEQMPALRRELQHAEGIGPITLMMHFAEADGARGIDWQLERFTRMTAGMNYPVSMANSAAILRYPQTAHDWVRPGIVLYGASPLADASAESFGLKPVMTLSSKILGVQDVPVGDRVGYGGTYEVKRPTRIGIVACGYADGYPRHAPSGTPILVAGKRTTTVGRVSMDMLACDLTDIPDAGVDSPVVLWGEGMPADEVATAAGTISYEMFCALARRVPIVEV